MKDKGAIAPGRQADLLVLSDLVNVEVEDVYYKGQLIDKNENIVIKPCAPELKNTVHVAEFSKEAFHLESKDGTFPVILCEEGQITTRKRNPESFRMVHSNSSQTMTTRKLQW